MKKIIVTTAICTAFFSTLAYADSPAVVPQAGQTPEEIAKEALEQVKALDKKIDNVGQTAGNAETKAIANEVNIQKHEDKINGYDQKIKDLDKKIEEKAEAFRTTGTNLIAQAQDAQVKATEAKGKAEAAQQTADKAQQTAEKAEETAKTATQNVDKFDKEIQSLRDDIQNAMGAPKGSVMKEMNELRNQTNKGLAKVTALAGLHPLAFDKNNKLSLSVANGSYKSEHALALGGFYQPNRDVLLSFASSMSGNDNAYTFGASVRLGSHSKTAEKQHVSQVAGLYAAIAKLQAQVEQQQKEIVQLQRVK